MDDRGNIKFGPAEKLRIQGFTEPLTDDEALFLLQLPEEERKEALKIYREGKLKEKMDEIKTLEDQVARKENMLNQMKKDGSKVQQVACKKRQGSFTKKKTNEQKRKEKRQAEKKSRKRNRRK